MADIIHQARAIRQGEHGQTMAEYAVVLAIITLAIVGAFNALSGSITTAIGGVGGLL